MQATIIPDENSDHRSMIRAIVEICYYSELDAKHVVQYAIGHKSAIIFVPTLDKTAWHKMQAAAEQSKYGIARVR